MHPYLACQMSNYEFRKPLRGSNSGVRAEISTYLAFLLAILLSLARQARRDKETQQFILVRATCGVIPYSSVLVDCLEGLRMN